MRTSRKISLMFVGLPVCIFVGAGSLVVVENCSELFFGRGLFGLNSQAEGVLLTLGIIVAYAAWAWLVLRRWKPKEKPGAFEVLPPKG